jgi:hypothetical protein
MLCAVRTIHRLSICAHTIIVSALLAIDAIFCPETSIAFCTDGGTVHFACGTCCCSAASAFADVLFTLLFDNAEASIAPDTVVILVLGTSWPLHLAAVGTSALVRLALLSLHVRTSMAAPTHDGIMCGTFCALQCFATNASADVWRARVCVLVEGMASIATHALIGLVLCAILASRLFATIAIALVLFAFVAYLAEARIARVTHVLTMCRAIRTWFDNRASSAFANIDCAFEGTLGRPVVSVITLDTLVEVVRGAVCTRCFHSP